MTDTTHLCALLRPLVSKHRYGAPLGKDELVRLAPFASHEEGAIRDSFEDLRELDFVLDHGPRGVKLDSSAFGSLADFLYHDCEWATWEIEPKLHHYEGWDDHDWA